MKKFFVMATVLLCMFTVTTAFAAKQSVDEQRRQIDSLSDKKLARLYEKYPNAQRIIEEDCYAYATLSNTGIKLVIFGDAHGRGICCARRLGLSNDD